MTEMIDRVAVAIRETMGTRHHGQPKGGWDGLMKIAAVAAIEAMREPTSSMSMGAFLALEPESRRDDIWRAMIDAALSSS